MSYSHLTIQNDTLKAFLPHLTQRAMVKQLITASPLSMGLLTPKPPAWHPAPDAVKTTCVEAGTSCAGWNGGLPNIALGYAYRMAKELGVATVAGFGVPGEVHKAMKIWREIVNDGGSEARQEYENRVIGVLRENEHKDYSWRSP